MSGRARILLVEDDESIRQFIELALDDQGYEVRTAPHGRAALEVAARWPPQLILLDIRMPVMDGENFAAAYRATVGPLAPLIVITAAKDPAGLAGQVGAVGHLAKPFDLRELLAQVRRALASQP